MEVGEASADSRDNLSARPEGDVRVMILNRLRFFLLALFHSMISWSRKHGHGLINTMDSFLDEDGPLRDK